MDRSSSFVLQKQADVDVNGQLILPKLFRRASSYLSSIRKKEFKGNIKQWLVWTQAEKKSENDTVQIGGDEQRLSDLLEVRGGNVSFKADLLEMVFKD